MTENKPVAADKLESRLSAESREWSLKDHMHRLDARGVVRANLSKAGYSVKGKYLNLFPYAIPFFAFFHAITVLGSFPWIFLFTTKNALAGESTAETRATVAAILWAFGYLVNATVVI